MSEVVLRGARRKETGKGYAKALRRQGKIPAILYGAGETPVPLELDQKEVQTLIHREGKNAVISLLLGRERKKDRKTIICDTQYDPLGNDLIHVDFKHVSLSDTVVLAVPVVLRGDPVEDGPNFFIAVIGTGEDINSFREKMKRIVNKIHSNFGTIINEWDGDLRHFNGIEENFQEIMQKNG